MGAVAGFSGRALGGLLCALSLAVVASSGADAGTCWYGPTLGRTVPVVGDCVDTCFRRATARDPWVWIGATQRLCRPDDEHDTRMFSWRTPTSYDPSGIGGDVARTGVADEALTTTTGGTSLSDVTAAARRIAGKLQNYGTRLGAGDLTDVFDTYQADIADDVNDLISQVKNHGCLSGISGLVGGSNSAVVAPKGLWLSTLSISPFTPSTAPLR